MLLVLLSTPPILFLQSNLALSAFNRRNYGIEEISVEIKQLSFGGFSHLLTIKVYSLSLLNGEILQSIIRIIPFNSCEMPNPV